MRQMKRALSLVLAMIMLLGMVMVPTSAAGNFTDADLIENTEAVEITSGIGLFAGTTDGRFAPKATVTRAQMATIIVKMLRGNDFNADAFKGVGVNPFPDTASFEGGWAEGYINACYQMGAVAGYGNGTFQPGNELTTAEAITMIINALGVDPGPGEWPMNYMAKAEEMKLYGDLANKPATDEPLNRDQLAVIVWEGMQYSPEGQTGWRISGYDMVFENYADALKANGGSASGIDEAVGEDTLASKVYDLKVAAGFVTGNQATGLEYTELSTLDLTSNTFGSEKFNIETGLDAMGHYVTIYYEEPYESKNNPGKTYAILDESEQVVVREAISTSKDYKKAFGTSHKLSGTVLNFDSSYVDQYDAQYDLSAQKLTTRNYTAGNKAPAGTYIIRDGEIVAYIESAPIYASYIMDIGTVEDEETVTIVLPNRSTVTVDNTEDNDLVLEYDGMKVGDFVTYQKVRDLYVLSPVQAVTGLITKTTTTRLNGHDYDTIVMGDTEYLAFEYQGETGRNAISASGKLYSARTDIKPGQNYTVYLDADGYYVGFEAISGALSLDSAVFLLGSITTKKTDQYGNTVFYNNGRGIDMGGKEVLIPIGRTGAKTEGGKLVPNMDDPNLLGSMDMVLQGYYSVADSTDKEEKEEELKILTSYPGAYSPENPTYAVQAHYTASAFTGTSSIATQEGINAQGRAGMKFFTIYGELTDDAPLTVDTAIPSGFMIERNENYYLLVTRAENSAFSYIDAFVYREASASGTKTYFYATQEQIDTAGMSTDGKAYTVYSAENGSETEIVISRNSGASLTTPGMYCGTQDEDGVIINVESVTEVAKPAFDDNTPQFATNIGLWGVTGNRLRGERIAASDRVAIDMITGWANTAENAAVLDLRSDAEISRSGVAKITSLAQLAALRENDPGLMVVYNVYATDRTSSTCNIVTAFITKVVPRTVGMNSVVYALDDPDSGDTMVAVRSLTADLGEKVPVNFEAGENAGPGFYRYTVNANGELVLVPYDIDVASNGTYGMLAMHDAISKYQIVDAGTIKLTTINANHSGCKYSCTDSTFEPLKEFYVTSNTLILDEQGNEIKFADMPALLRNNDLVINYYCDTPVYSASTTIDRDESAELVVISSRNVITTSCDGNHDGYLPVDSADDITGPGNYYLTANLTEALTITDSGVTLCMAGHSILPTSGDAVVCTSGDLTLISCDGREGGRIVGNTGYGVHVQTGGTVTIDDAVCVDGALAGGKVNVQVDAGGTFTMVGGSVSGNTSASGVNNEGTLNLKGGSISGNTAANGAGVYNKGTLNLSDNGSISSNTANSNGGGVYNTGTIIMTGGTISGNTAKISSGHAGGGGVYNTGSLTLSAGSISGNTTSRSGGGVLNTGTLTVNGGEIGWNNATFVGGGVFNNDSGTTTVNNGTITGNKAATYGGGMAVRLGTVNIKGGTIAGNTLTADFGTDISCGYYGGNGGTVTISGGVVGTAGSTANNLMVHSTDKTMVVIKGDAVINGTVGITGTTGKSYGAILNIEGGTINGDVINGDEPNSASLKSLSYKTQPCKLNITGGTINGTVTEGSGAWLETLTSRGKVTTTITGGTFTTDPSAYVPSSTHTVTETDGSFTVTAK